MTIEPRPRIPISADWVLKRIQEGKNVRLKNAIIEGDLDLNKLDLPTQHIERTEELKQMSLKEDVIVVKSSIKIINSEIQGNLDFSNATFSGYAGFNGATFSGDAGFKGATFSGYAWFDGATFSGDAGFNGATFSEDAGFGGAKFEGDVLEFKNSIFIDAKSQENACRRAKNVLEKNGDREEAGYHFYREMEGKRKQKESDYGYFDYEALLFCKETVAIPKELTDLFKYLRYNVLEGVGLAPDFSPSEMNF